MTQRLGETNMGAAATASAAGLQSLLTSAEELLDTIKDQQGAAANDLRQKLSDTIGKARDRLDDFDARETASDAIDSTVGFIRSSPWRSVAIGGLAVLAVTLLLRLGSDD